MSVVLAAVICDKDPCPIATFLSAATLVANASLPIAILLLPIVFAPPESLPIKTF